MHSPGWRDPRREHNWRSSLERFVYPQIGDMAVSEISAEHVLAVIAPIWADRRETAKKTLGRIRAVMAWSIAEGHRTDDPTAAVGRALPRNGHQVQHHAALPASEVGAAIRTVRASGCWWATAACFELIALTGVRSGEARLATWAEVDFDAEVWTVGASRTKTSQEQRVPLSRRAVEVLRDAHERTGGVGLCSRPRAGDRRQTAPSASGSRLSTSAALCTV